MTKVLVNYAANYADEFDVEAFKVFESRELYEDWISSLSFPVTNYFGTNEDIEHHDLDELMSHLSILLVSDEQAHTLKVLLGSEYGTGSSIFYLGE